MISNEKKHKRNWDDIFNILVEYIDSSEEVKKYLKKNGSIRRIEYIEKNGEVIDIGSWLTSQRLCFMKRYQGLTIKQIEENENIPQKDKNKMIKLLSLGVKYTTTEEQRVENNKKNWDKKFNLLEKYINSSEKIKKIFEQTGSISISANVEKNGEIINLGTWLNTQKCGIMKKYHGMNIEQIKKDDQIPDWDKYRMKKLLNLGVTYSKLKGQYIGKVSYNSSIQSCDKADEKLNILKTKREEKTTDKI